MINDLAQKPAGYFEKLGPDHFWLELSLNREVYAYMAIKVDGNQAGLHFEVITWTHNVYKELVNDWDNILNILKDNGIKHLIAANDNYTDERWPKFIGRFGFPRPTIVAFSKQEI